MAEHDEQAQKARNVAAALGELERSIGLLAFHIERTFSDAEQRYELADYLANLRRAVRKVEDDL
jgi:hypothetical protein